MKYCNKYSVKVFYHNQKHFRYLKQFKFRSDQDGCDASASAVNDIKLFVRENQEIIGGLWMD